MDKVDTINERKKSNEERNKLYSQNRLRQNVGKKIQTTMIGALSSFEEQFGKLWGIGVDGDLTDEQKMFKELWEKTRTDVLNKGNKQFRAAMEEISEYTTEWNKYKATLIVR